jgi:hypothetical protein
VVSQRTDKGVELGNETEGDTPKSTRSRHEGYDSEQERLSEATLAKYDGPLRCYQGTGVPVPCGQGIRKKSNASRRY